MIEKEYSAQEMQVVQGVAQKLRERMGAGYSIELKQMEMTTKTPYFGACVSVPGTNVLPVFLAEEWLTLARQGMSQGEIADLMTGRIREAERGMARLPRMDFTRESILRDARFSIGSEEKHGEILSHVPCSAFIRYIVNLRLKSGVVFQKTIWACAIARDMHLTRLPWHEIIKVEDRSYV